MRRLPTASNGAEGDGSESQSSTSQPPAQGLGGRLAGVLVLCGRRVNCRTTYPVVGTAGAFPDIGSRQLSSGNWVLWLAISVAHVAVRRSQITSPFGSIHSAGRPAASHRAALAPDCAVGEVAANPIVLMSFR